MGADRPYGVRNPAVAGRRLIKTYTDLARDGEHLLGGLLAGHAPIQWRHYPENDAIDEESGYQWFYHSHSPEDRPGSTEHGHLHIFARRKLWSRRMQSQHERAFAEMSGSADRKVTTRHLIGIGLNSRGIPTTLFTVNSWVTGDLMLCAENTRQLIRNVTLNTGNSRIDSVIEDLLTLCQDEVLQVLDRRDQALHLPHHSKILEDQSLEVLSEIPIELDEKILPVQMTDFPGPAA